MVKLSLKLLRDLKQAPVQFIALALIIAVGAFFYSGLNSYSNKHRAYTESYFREHRLSDLNVFYERISGEDAAKLSRIEGINKIESRYTFDAEQVFEGYKAVLKVHSIPANNEINTPAVLEGAIPANKDEILLDSHYAQEHQYQVGDSIKLNIDGREAAFTVSGLGENVEYVKKNATQDHKNNGFAYIAEAAVPGIADGLYYNELLIDAEEGYDMDKMGKSVEEQSKALPYLDQVSKERTYGYSQIQQTIYNNNMMSKVIPLVLFLISAIILFLTMSRTIDSERTQVGIMKALGVKNRSIMLHYMGYPVLAGIVGSILGCALAAAVFIPLVTASSAKSYSLPGITFSLSWFSVIPPILFSSAFGLLSVYLSGRAILKERAAQAMRPRPPKKMKKLLIERTPVIWSRLSYSYKLILRNIFLNKQKALASSIGVVVSTVLLITALGTQSSLQKIANQVEDAYTYDLRVDYKAGTSLAADMLQLPAGITSHYFLSSIPVELIKGDEKENAALVVTDQQNSLIHFFDEQDKKLSLDNDGVLVPKSYADHYQIAVGDTITLKFTAPAFKNKAAEMKVLHISSQYTNPSFYITPAYLQRFGIDYNPSSLLVEAANAGELAAVRSFFEQDQRVDTVADKTDLKKSAQYILKQNSFMFVMFIICAVVLSFGAIYTISSINIYERNRELATLKVLGYEKYKINRLIFAENIILTTFAVIAALPVSGYFYALVVKALSSTHQQIPGHLNLFILLASVLLAYLLTILSNLLLRRKVVKINMIESLKGVE